MTVELVTLEATSTDAFAEMVVGLYAEDPSPVQMTIDRAREQTFFLVGQSGVLPFVIREVGCIVGYAIVVPYYSNEYGGEIGILDEFYVIPSKRGRGVGAAAMRGVVELARERGWKRVELLVNHANVRARKLYERLGYKALSRTTMSLEVRLEVRPQTVEQVVP